MYKLIILLLCTSVFGYRPYCDEKSVLRHLRTPTYDFSVRILDRVAQETDGHFVFSPISTWLQLLALTDGAEGNTLKEMIWVTKYYRLICFRKLVREIFNSVVEELHVTIQHTSVIVIDNLLDVKQSFVRNVEKFNAAKVLLVNFKRNIESAAKVNEVIERDTNGAIVESVDSHDFVESVLLMIDAACIKANWRSPFNHAYTTPETFYSYEKIPIGEVNMMHQIGYFRIGNVPDIDAQALELPFSDRLTMILFLPTNGTAADLFWSMRKIRLNTIFKAIHTNGPRLVNVKLPRFKVTTDVDNIPELLYDMGVQKIFYPRLAELRKISDYKVYVSAMMNKADIEVTETGVLGRTGPEMLVTPKESIELFFNQPFAYLIMDKITNVIMFAGIYSDPSRF